jgi:DNA repair exonuclease SbcCD nuclease subunit
MKFLHLSDTHLGYKQYGINDREQDFWDVFEEAINIAIENNVDFILHSGDFFHTSRPSNETLLKAINVIKKLNELNIPFFCISGNHDRGSNLRDKSPLAILETLGLNLLDEKKYISFEGIGITGVKYLSKSALRKYSFKDILEKLAEVVREDFKILLLHQEFSPYFQDTNLDIYNDIPDSFNYVGIGHYHIFTEPIKRDNSTILHIGSTEFTAYNPREEEVFKRVALVKINNDKSVTTDFIRLNKVRPFIFQEIDENNLDHTIENLINKLNNLNSSKKPVLILKGILKKRTVSEILSYIKDKVNENEFLTIRANFSFVVDTNKEDTKFIKKDKREDFIRDKLRELIEDENTFEEIYSIIESLKTEEDISKVKESIKNIDFYKILE